MASLANFLYRLRNPRACELLRQHLEDQWLPRETVLQEQMARVRELVGHAYRHNDYYRSLFNAIGMKPQDIRSPQDFQAVPILTKQIIKENFDRLISRGFPPQTLVRNTSGGSTGEPLSFIQERELYVRMEANGRLGYAMANWTGNETIFEFWGNPREFRSRKSFRTRVKETITRRVIFNSYSYNEEKIASWVKAIRCADRCFLYGYTSVLADVARHVQQQGVRITSVKGILATAEKLYPWQRALLESSFEARVYDQYGSREVPGMACECGEGNMHQLPHSAYLEFVADPAVANGSRKIIATCLTNFAMPFIRYDIGDYARPKEGECPCGRAYPMMEMDIGRTTDRFVTPEGNLVYGTFFVRQMYGQERVRNFQFRQVAPDEVQLAVVRAPGFDAADAARVDAIRQTIHEQISSRMRLKVSYVDAIPRTQGGKHRFVISEVPT